MKWLTALLLGAILGFVLPLVLRRPGRRLDEQLGEMGHRSARIAGSPGLLFSIPLFLGSAVAFRLFFNWHSS